MYEPNPEREIVKTMIIFFAVVLTYFLITPLVMTLADEMKANMLAQGGANLTTFASTFYNIFTNGWHASFVLGIIVLIYRLWAYIGRTYYASDARVVFTR